MSGSAVDASSGRVVVVGGGLAGLSAAWRLEQAGRVVTVLEAADRVGGFVDTVEVSGHLFERGPSTVLARGGHIRALIEEMGLTDRVVTSHPSARKRLVWRRGRVHVVPSGPGSMVTSGLISLSGKLRMLVEPLVPTRLEGPPETVGAMLERRLGREAVDALADPIIGGIYAAHVDRLGTDAFPVLRQLERDHGSLFRGMLARRRARREEGQESGTPSGLLSLEGGLCALPAAVSERLGPSIRLGCRATGLSREGEDGPWNVNVRDGETPSHVVANQVVLAVPAWAAASLLAPSSAEAADVLASVQHPPIVAVGLGYGRPAQCPWLDAFGILCCSQGPHPGGAPVLGILFTSTIFPGRAPHGEITLTVMMGGGRNPELGDGDEHLLVQHARRAAEAILGVSGDPLAVAVSRWPRGIPIIPPGHLDRVAEVQAAADRLGSLVLAGNYLSGVGLDAVIGSGFAAAARLLAVEA